MPITKIPITHKFGIISQSQRDDLQNRLLEKKLKKPTSPTQHQPIRNPLELSDDFIRKFNMTSDLDEKEKLEDEARKLLARAKRRAGLKEGGRGNFVDLPKAWSELSMLAQCRGKVQEECLDTLIISLHQAPLLRSHIPCLFYLAETTLYWLRTDAMDQPFLRIGEIKLLKMGYTTFLCLFYHHMAGHLHNFGELKDRLATYLSAILDGYSDSEEAYGQYPGSHLCLKFIVSVGKMLAGEALLEMAGLTQEAQATDTNYFATERNTDCITPMSPPNSVLLHVDGMKQQRSKDKVGQEVPLLDQSLGYQSSIHDLTPTLWHALDVWRCVDHLGEGFQEAVKSLSLCGNRLATEHWVDATCAICVIGETALGNVTVLKALQNLAKGVLPRPKAAQVTIANEDDDEDDLLSLDSIESSKRSVTSLDSMEIKFEEMLGVRGQSRGEEGKKTDPLGLFLGRKKLSDASHISHQKSTRNTSMLAYLDTPLHERVTSLTSDCGMAKPSPGSSSCHTIPDISSCDESQLDSAGCMRRWSGSRLSDVHDVEDSDLAPGEDSLVNQRNVDVTKTPDFKRMNDQAETPTKLPEEVGFDIVISSSPNDLPKRKSSMRDPSGAPQGATNRSPSTKSVVIDPVPSTNFYSEGSDGNSEKTNIQKKGFSLTKQITNQYGITSWPWEVAYAYTETISSICLYGRTANIKKLALIGDRKGLNVTRHKEMEGRTGDENKLRSAGLLDLAEVEKDETGKEDDWSWRIRYAAIAGLVKISRSCQNDQSMDGMRTVVWNMLMIRHSHERDDRVMEAFRVGQVNAQIECEMQKSRTNQSLNFRLAAGLASTYLPPLQPPVQPVKRRTKPSKVEITKPTESPRKGPNRPSLREELLLATALPEIQTSLYSRTDLDLKRIVEDQWRKELQEQIEEEEKQKREDLEKQQKELEEKQPKTQEEDK